MLIPKEQWLYLEKNSLLWYCKFLCFEHCLVESDVVAESFVADVDAPDDLPER